MTKKGTIKGHMVYDVKHTCDCLPLEVSISTTESLENILTTKVIDANK